ncbi:hypothetical protein CcrKarma_gp076 [Caulobacter virus Karma]|uniref:Uncharacterized protein n=6 Tax=Viruses TaxID=10239 RepID=J3UIL7_9CAUD|nr:hypothetical protein D865_gp075 [Caulobacter phage phiCbK]YP_006989456.1 hypothetical protein CcrKarma_gp076 [Caulobacter virus Karma]YP_006989806.1 hypothetical protein D870_gp073 [Caulobacter phage CcrSwift]ARB14292.1 hypothetical protein Ccr5_gp074 [Caulobacter phage Ccr5]ARB14995.1 hypothetical protein Ccr32_gp076 [Caulobacter phage Ccr32]ARB15325.1 hypothetical protein Ccr34_gp076 [Caulobacter phage Ccr34]AFO71759.1 hypothetical protein phiCbK_243 [Caulobacter phage phiCbK]AFU86907.1
MASLVYNSMLHDLVNGDIAFDTDTFKVMLVTSAYTPNKDTHTRKNQVTNEVTGAGYTAGGQTSAVTITPDTANDREDLSFATVTWTSATITARAAVIYKDTGTATTSPLIAYVDFGTDVSSTNANFAVSFSSPLRFQN